MPLAAQRPFSMGDLADLRLWWEGRARFVAEEAAVGILADTGVTGGLTISRQGHTRITESLIHTNVRPTTVNSAKSISGGASQLHP